MISNYSKWSATEELDQLCKNCLKRTSFLSFLVFGKRFVFADAFVVFFLLCLFPSLYSKRLDDSIEKIRSNAYKAAYTRALHGVQEEEAIRKAVSVAPTLDGIAGSEVPFCQWSEAELRIKMAS